MGKPKRHVNSTAPRTSSPPRPPFACLAIIVSAVPLVGLIMYSMTLRRPTVVLPGNLHAAGALNRPHRPVEPLLRSVHKHDSSAFTQGLLFHDGYLYESTGLYGQSSLRKVEPATGKVVKQVSLPRALFGEGLAMFEEGGRQQLLQLTWRERVALVYDLESFHELRRFTPPATVTGEYWGVAFNGSHFFVTDGSEYVHVWDRDMQEVIRYPVIDPTTRKPVKALNEVEVIGDDLYANIWYDKRIARISPSGAVLGYLDFSKIYKGKTVHDVLNGIAYDKDTSSLYITGKNWEKLFVYQL